MPSSDPSRDVLAQPTRARLFARLARLNRPATTDELAIELGLHPSGVRVHLDRLRATGLVERHRVPQARGRPRDSWQLAAESQPGPRLPDAYPRLAAWLAKSIPPSPSRLRQMQITGREIGHELVGGLPGAGVEAEEAVGRALTALGFAPRRATARRGRVRFTLGTCPYRDAVHANQPVVCALHRGVTVGLLDQLAPAASLSAFMPKEPDRAGCVIEIRGLAPASPFPRTAA